MIESVEITATMEVRMHPNPARSHVFLDLQSPVARPYEIRMYDLAGRVVRAWNGKAEAGMNTIDLDIESAGKGIYLLQLATDAGRQTQKLVIE